MARSINAGIARATAYGVLTDPTTPVDPCPSRACAKSLTVARRHGETRGITVSRAPG